MALVGNCFYNISSIDPGTGFPGYMWLKTDLGTMWIRNTADTAWVLIGDSNQPYFGQLSTQGGNLNGALTGAHGLAPASSNNFSSSLYLAGDAVTTKTYVDNQIAALNAAIATSVTSALSSISSVNISSRVARSSGEVSFSGTGTLPISLPQYSDGSQAQEPECVWGAYLTEVTTGYFTSGNFVSSITQTSNRNYALVCQKDGVTPFAAKVGWFIIGFRSS